MAEAAARKAGLWTKLAYGSGAAANGIKNNGFEYFLLFFYSQVLGVDSALVGATLMIAMFVDGISDPIVGYWSDNLKTRLGRRHPFMYASIIPVAIAYIFAWNPPEGITGNALFPYLLMITILGLSMVAILAGRIALKGLAAAGLGLMIGTIGEADAGGSLRMATYDIPSIARIDLR